MTLALDTSVAVPLLSADHVAHRAVAAWWDGRPVVLAGHAAAVETYAAVGVQVEVVPSIGGPQ